jgi:hypothetical protein
MKVVDELKKEYDIDDDDINQYLDVGYSVHDIAFVIDQEIKEMKAVQDAEDEVQKCYGVFNKRGDGFDY